MKKKTLQKRLPEHQKFVCVPCGYAYDPERGGIRGVGLRQALPLEIYRLIGFVPPAVRQKKSLSKFKNTRR